MGNIQTRYINHQKLNNDYYILEKKYNDLEKNIILCYTNNNECVKNEFHDITNTLEIILKSKNDDICV